MKQHILNSTAGTLASDATDGDVAWTDPGNAVASDNAYATSALNNQSTEWLLLTNWGFTIPDYAMITGIKVEVEKKADDTLVYDRDVNLWYGGAAVGTDKADTTTEWSRTADAWAVYGGDGDNWGYSLSPTIVNTSTFGIGFRGGTAAARTLSVDHIRMTVYYTIPEGANPGTMATVAGADVAWTDPNNAKTSNGSYATAALNNQRTNTLRATNFGFSIPDNATISGLTAWVEKKTSGGTVTDNLCKLSNGGSVIGSDKKSSTAWGTSDAVTTYGGDGDDWGASLTPTIVNSSTFGLDFGAITSDNITASVDNIRMRVFWTTGNKANRR